MTKAEVKEAVTEAMQEKLGEFFIEREKHYQHHLFIDGVIDTKNKVKTAAIRTTTFSAIGLIITIIWLGLKDYFKSLFAIGGH